ncbi:MAG: DegT/DnrJ/EryC1/StrS family aminotransferase, partial [Pyrinomonadaceae bacterium]
MINEGSLARELENVFRDRYAAHAAVACSSGSQALMLALEAVGVSPGDQVMVPTYVCAEVLATIEAIGATALIVDVEDDYLMSVSAARVAQTVQCKAIVFPYVMGIWRDVTPFREFGLPIIEDCAQFIPDETMNFGGVRGDLAIFSFEATKLITSGEGGMVVARDKKLANRLEAVKRYGETNYKLNLYPLADLLAALALSQFSSLRQFLHRRRELANKYFEKLAGVSGISLPQGLRNRSIFFRFPVRLADHLAGKLEQLIAELLA